jgi:hypothetical protein
MQPLWNEDGLLKKLIRTSLPPNGVELMTDEEHAELTASFDDLDGNCLVNIISCLLNDDMNSIAINLICSQKLPSSKIEWFSRSNLELEQSYVLKVPHLLRVFAKAFVRQEWGPIFTGSQTRLKVMRLERMPHIEPNAGPSASESQASLHMVSSLDMSHNSFPGTNNWRLHYSRSSAFEPLQEIDLSHSNLRPMRRHDMHEFDIRRVLCANFLWVRRVIWNSCNLHVSLRGEGF